MSGGGMRAVDTNLLVRLIARDDVKQAAAVDAYVERGGWVSHLALAEATWVLSEVYERDAADIKPATSRKPRSIDRGAAHRAR